MHAILVGPGSDAFVTATVEVFLARYADDEDRASLDCVRLADDAGATVLELHGDDATRLVISDRWPDGVA